MEKDEEIETFPEEGDDAFTESFDDAEEDAELPEEEDQFDDSDDEDAEELFRQNPLRAIFVRQKEIMEMLSNGN